MLSYEFMGAIALWVLFVNTALIAGAAIIDLKRLRRPYGGFRRLGEGELGSGVLVGRVEATNGESPAFARLSIHRTGRLADGPTLGIQFGAQAPVSTLFGGRVGMGESSVEVSAGPGRVWLDPKAIDSELARFAESELPEAEDAARRRRGLQRTTELDLQVGATIYLAGRLERQGQDLVLRGSEEEPILASAVDPKRFVDAQTAKVLGFLGAMSLVLALVTRLALSEPLFGPLSKLGGVLGLAYFLLVLPAATWLRERTAAPDRRSYFGLWRTNRPLQPSTAGAALPPSSVVLIFLHSRPMSRS